MPSPNLQPLAVQNVTHSSNPLTMTGRLSLPIAVQKSVYTTIAEEDLYLWINGPDGGETNPLRITSNQIIEQLPKLDVMVGGAVYCRGEFVLTGIDQEQKPIVLGIDRDGNEVWRYQLEGPVPTVWQRPYCVEYVYLVWQTSPQVLNIAQVQEDGLHHQQSVNIRVPPTNIVDDGQAIYALGASDNGLEGIKIGNGDIQPLHIGMPYPDNLTFAGVHNKLYIAWTQKKTAHIAQILDGNIRHLWEQDLGSASFGKIMLISGAPPILWSQYSEYDGNNISQWSSIIFQQQHDPLQISGLVQNMVKWGKTLVVVGSMDILLFEQSY